MVIIFAICLIATLAISMIDGINAATHTIDPKTPGGLQGAVANASDGDTIYLKNGVYTGDKNVYVQIDKSITIKGQGPNVILDGRGDVITYAGRERAGCIFWFYTLTGKPVSSATFENLKFRNTELGAMSAAIDTATFCDKLTVKNCVFTNNKGKFGGAIDYVGSSGKSNSLTVIKCTFQGNKVSKGYSGAIRYVGDGTLTVDKCTFKNNAGSNAGAIVANPLMKKTCSVKITNSKFEKNTGKVAGAINVLQSKFTITGSTFTNNKATKKSHSGGAIGLYHSTLQKTTGTITNSKFTKNIAGNVYNAIYKHNKVKLTKKNVKITPKDGTKVKK